MQTTGNSLLIEAAAGVATLVLLQKVVASELVVTLVASVAHTLVHTLMDTQGGALRECGRA
jgi:hypothetical protein